MLWVRNYLHGVRHEGENYNPIHTRIDIGICPDYRLTV